MFEGGDFAHTKEAVLLMRQLRTRSDAGDAFGW